MARVRAAENQEDAYRAIHGRASPERKEGTGGSQPALGQRARELAGPLPFVGPREYGSNYLSNEGTEGLLSINKTLALDRALAAQSAIKMGNGSVTATGAELGNAEIAGVAGPINDMLALGAPVLAVGDAMASIDACLKLRTDRDKAKATLLRSFPGCQAILDLPRKSHATGGGGIPAVRGGRREAVRRDAEIARRALLPRTVLPGWRLTSRPLSPRRWAPRSPTTSSAPQL